MLDVLVRNAGKLVSQRQLLHEVWGPAYGDESNYLRVHMAHLRAKLEPERSHPRYFITEPGHGLSVRQLTGRAAVSIPSTSKSAASQTARRAVTLAAPSARTATSVPGSSSPPGAS